jgi:NADPH:quinone reductase-like Zn-dependent oxidoreductase
VIVDVRAAALNPADYKHIAPGQDPALLPLSLGFEVAGAIRALGPGTEIASGGGAPGDEVIAAQITGGYATQVSVSASDVFAKPETLTFAAAAGLILVGSTAAELLHAAGVTAAGTVLLHGAGEAVDASLALVVPERRRIVTTTAFARAEADGFAFVGARNPDSAPYRARIRPHLLELAAAGRLSVPVGATFPFAQAPAAPARLTVPHPSGKLALLV